MITHAESHRSEVNILGILACKFGMSFKAVFKRMDALRKQIQFLVDYVLICCFWIDKRVIGFTQ